MTKKEYIIAFLEKVAPENDIALAMYTMLDKTELNNEMIELMYDMIREAMHDALSEKEREKYLLIQSQLQHIHHSEQKHYDEKDLERLLNTIE